MTGGGGLVTVAPGTKLKERVSVRPSSCQNPALITSNKATKIFTNLTNFTIFL